AIVLLIVFPYSSWVSPWLHVGFPFVIINRSNSFINQSYSLAVVEISCPLPALKVMDSS
ncbi:hypothetical protein HAX54_011661, partial [Datura stramonium]|nr:hypothetical protein [Datura stramonium]